MSMLVNGKAHVDPNNVPLSSSVSQEEQVDVNFIKRNNFNNNAYRNNFGSKNYMPYPSNSSTGYYGRSMHSEDKILEVEKDTKFFMQMQYEQNKLFTKNMEEQSAMLKNISHQLENLNGGISDLQAKISNDETRISSLSEAQTSFNKSVEEKLGKIDVLASNVDSLALDVDLLKLKVMLA